MGPLERDSTVVIAYISLPYYVGMVVVWCAGKRGSSFMLWVLGGVERVVSLVDSLD